MERPLELIFVRHGESEANIVQQREKLGDFSGYTESFREKSNADMELTNRGIEQAKAAGKWIKANINQGYFDNYYVSSFQRALQTAGNLQLPEPETLPVWKIRDYLREQSWGYFDNMPKEERDNIFPQIAKSLKRDKLYLAPLGGESMYDLAFRTKIGIIQTLYREVPGMRGIVIAHGSVLWTVRIIMEGLTKKDYELLDNKENPLDKMHNCQILQYSRIDPDASDRITANFAWVRTVCPWDLSLSRNLWQQIKRPKYTNQQLLEL